MASIDFTYDSQRDEGFSQYPLASGFISSTYFNFRRQKLHVRVDAEGCVVFMDEFDRPITRVTIPAMPDGKKKYLDVRCCVAGDTLVLEFPSYVWTDHYPHCDGESDRWDATVTGWPLRVEFDPNLREPSWRWQ